MTFRETSPRGRALRLVKAMVGDPFPRPAGERPSLALAHESNLPRTLAGQISCVVCAYNEAERIGAILEAVDRHPALLEVIVVNDGSTDATEALLAHYPNIKIISYSPNRGKTYALSRGIALARGEYLMLLDADLAGVRPADIQALADPVLDGWADGFVSGERVIPARLGREAIAEMRRLPRWGGESYLNRLIVRDQLSLAVVKWPGVFNIRKFHKVGVLRGLVEEIKMTIDALKVLSPFGVVGQNLALLRLVCRPPARQTEMSWTRSLNRRLRISQ
jgi:hypothetical protein